MDDWHAQKPVRVRPNIHHAGKRACVSVLDLVSLWLAKMMRIVLGTRCCRTLSCHMAQATVLPRSATTPWRLSGYRRRCRHRPPAEPTYDRGRRAGCRHRFRPAEHCEQLRLGADPDVRAADPAGRCGRSCGTSGTVRQIGMRATRLATSEGADVVVRMALCFPRICSTGR